MNCDNQEVVSVAPEITSNIAASTSSSSPSSSQASPELPARGRCDAISVTDSSLPDVLEDVAGPGMSPMFSCSPRTPSIVLTPREVSVEGRLTSHCIPTFDLLMVNRNGEEVCAVREGSAHIEPHRRDALVEERNSGNLYCGGGAGDDDEALRSKLLTETAYSQSAVFTSGSVEEHPAHFETLLVRGCPVNADTSHNDPTQEKLRSLSPVKGVYATSETITEIANDGHRPPLSFMLTGGRNAKRRRRGHHTSAITPVQASSPSGCRYMWEEGSQRFGGALDFSGSSIMAVGQGGVNVEGNGTADWKRRCLFAEHQLAVAIRCLWEYHNTMSAQRQHVLSPADVDDIQPFPPTSGVSTSAVPNVNWGQQVKEDLDGEGGITKGETAAYGYEQGADVRTSGTDEQPSGVASDGCSVQRPTALPFCCAPGAVAPHPCSWAISTEGAEAKLVGEMDEWLAREKVVRLKQELLATALRQARLTAMRTMQRIEERELEFKAVISRCNAVKTALLESEAQVKRLRELDQRRVEENKRLQQRISELKAELRGCESNIDSNGGCFTDAVGLDEGDDPLSMSVSQTQDIETQLLHVVAALQCGESRRKWVADQLSHVLRRVNMGVCNKGVTSVSDHSKLMALVESLEALKSSEIVMLSEECGTPVVFRGDSDASTTTLKGCESTAELLHCAGECVAQLEKRMRNLYTHRSTLRVEMKATPVAYDVCEREECQLAQRPHLQPKRVEPQRNTCVTGCAAKEEITNNVEENVCPSHRNDTEAQLSVDSEFLDVRNRVPVLHSLYDGGLAHLQKHLEQQLDEFSHTLRLMLTEAIRWLFQQQSMNVVENKGSPAIVRIQHSRMPKGPFEEQKENQPMQQVGHGFQIQPLSVSAVKSGSKNRIPGLFIHSQGQSKWTPMPSPKPGGGVAYPRETPRSLPPSPLSGRMTLPPFVFEDFAGRRSTESGKDASADGFTAARSQLGIDVVAPLGRQQVVTGELTQRRSVSSPGRCDSLYIHSCNATNSNSPRLFPLSQNDPNLAGRWASVRLCRR
ncbi:hypothetical protein, conserved [Trypanosoma brucei gambiense DAL972]|uniref:Uncharacterized protein n=1 Tax=Trypanosoma brucei gambiense (strain MHOM/CI/86/DAL972) TaxID=679716 RepID=D0A5B5_TRYB9|nr:hypothetical protein, conserved [Trypanosoma brucei gambiense DAL972]CBH16459.1 hypothetical protein, conserved [Trypanosoma brucei gambiense DAL972]|eukprot:XP_011778723.1 hypothetical protein, conserved [Trypanosoma brucei gambiense DAL972]